MTGEMRQAGPKSVAATMPRPASRELPVGSCDTHTHLFGPFQRYPLRFPPNYPVPLAPVETYLRMLDLVGMDRGVLVQPTQQGCDNEIMLGALQQAGGRLRGVAAACRNTSGGVLEEMRQAGITGLRFVEAPTPAGASRPGAVGFDEINRLASSMQDLGWSIHVWAKLPALIGSLQKLLSPGLPVVFEHMGMLDVGKGTNEACFQVMLALLREGRIWVKLSFCRCSEAAPDYRDLRPFFDAVLAANPDRLVWGSDWPFIRMQGREPDCGALLDLLREWIDDVDVERKILVDNPARLFGFANPLTV